jgi:ADP-heptose:LPS heptosyltransferase
MGPRKRLLIRLIEAVTRPLVRVCDSSRDSVARRSGQVQRILVLECWNLGDIVMEVPFLRNLRFHYPDAHIALLTSPKCAQLVSGQGLVDELVIVRVPWAQHYSRWRKYNPFSPLWIEFLRTLKLLRAQKFHLAFSARADIRDNFIMWVAEAERRVGYAFGGGGFFLTDVAVPDLQNPHFSNRWLRLLQTLGKRPVVREPRLQITPSERESAERRLAKCGIQNGDLVIGIHPGARSSIRQWGEHNFKILAQRLQTEFSVKTVWFREPGQIETIENDPQCCSLSLPLRGFMGALTQCRLLICNDSGPMHIATALGVPVVAIFGPTEPAWFGPLGQNNRIVIQRGFWCRPCFDYCVFDQPYCLRTIEVESVFQAAVEALSSVFGKTREVFPNEDSLSRPVMSEQEVRKE